MKNAFFLLFLTAATLFAQQAPVELHIFSSSSEDEAVKAEEEPDQPITVPSALVERIVTLGERKSRISLFDNRVTVVTIRENGKQVFFRKWTLNKIEFDAYIKAFETCISKAGLQIGDSIETPDAIALIRLSFPGQNLREFQFSPFQILDLSTSRLNSILDDLEKRVSSIAPSAEELQTWQPKENDRIELYSGMIARVEEVREDGSIVLQHEETSILELVPHDAWPDVIFRILK